MCNYERFALKREREKKEKRNEEINLLLLDGLRRRTREESLEKLFSSLTFVLGTAAVVGAEQKSAAELVF